MFRLAEYTNREWREDCLQKNQAKSSISPMFDLENP